MISCECEDIWQLLVCTHMCVPVHAIATILVHSQMLLQASIRYSFSLFLIPQPSNTSLNPHFVSLARWHLCTYSMLTHILHNIFDETITSLI